MWNISCVHKHCHNVHGLCTHIYVQNFGMLEIVAHTRCTQTYFCVHEKICMQIFSFSIPVSIMLFVKGFSFNSILKVNASSPVSKQIPSPFLFASWPERSWSVTLILLWVFGMDNSNSCLFEMNFVRWNPDSLAHIHDSFYELFCKFNTFQ